METLRQARLGAGTDPGGRPGCSDPSFELNHLQNVKKTHQMTYILSEFSEGVCPPGSPSEPPFRNPGFAPAGRCFEPRLHDATFVEQQGWIFVQTCWPTKIEPCGRPFNIVDHCSPML